MIDNFALVLTHVLMALAIWRLLQRADLDADPAPTPDERTDANGIGPNKGLNAGKRIAPGITRDAAKRGQR